jgi:hypothetical protein
MGQATERSPPTNIKRLHPVQRSCPPLKMGILRQVCRPPMKNNVGGGRRLYKKWRDKSLTAVGTAPLRKSTLFYKICYNKLYE